MTSDKNASQQDQQRQEKSRFGSSPGAELRRKSIDPGGVTPVAFHLPAGPAAPSALPAPPTSTPVTLTLFP